MSTQDRYQAGPVGPCLFSPTRFVRRQELDLPPLCEAVTVALFTPALPEMRQAIENRTVSDCDDPFSLLGKAIMTGPTRSVVHVPYLPGKAVRDEHNKLVNRADLTIVVLCRTADPDPANDLVAQLSFAKTISDKGCRYRMCCVQCNVVNCEIGSTYGNVVVAPGHARSDLESVAKLLNGLVGAALDR